MHGNGGEEEGELRVRVPGIDVRIPPASSLREEAGNQPPTTTKTFPHNPVGAGHSAQGAAILLLSVVLKNCGSRACNTVRAYTISSDCLNMPSSSLDTAPTHDRPLECTPTDPLPFAERALLRDLPALTISLQIRMRASCWTVPAVPHASSQNDIFNCALSGAMRTCLRLL